MIKNSWYNLLAADIKHMSYPWTKKPHFEIDTLLFLETPIDYKKGNLTKNISMTSL